MKPQKQHNRLPVPYVSPAERQARRERQSDNIAWGVSIGAVLALCFLYPGMARALLAPVAFALALVVVCIQAGRAILEKPLVPAPPGEEVECASVQAADFAPPQPTPLQKIRAREQAENFKQTQQYATSTREGSFHIYGKGEDLEYRAEETEVEEEGRKVFETKYKLKK